MGWGKSRIQKRSGLHFRKSRCYEQELFCCIVDALVQSDHRTGYDKNLLSASATDGVVNSANKPAIEPANVCLA